VKILQLDDFNKFLHELRTKELEKLPPGAKVFLSGGCAGRWYFDWINNSYKGIQRHIGVEYYLPKPTDLPPEVEWIKNSLGDMSGVKDKNADLVFAGQTIEHLWPNEFASFLCEAYRVLKKDGLIILDSPNRRITHGLHWFQPQHTFELTVNEIVEILDIAGFKDLKVKGIWLCYDRKKHTFLPLEPNSNTPGMTYQERIELSKERPEDSFVWWVEAHKSNQKPNKIKLQEKLNKIFSKEFHIRLSSLHHQIGSVHYEKNRKIISCSHKEKGALIHGPYIPLKKGTYKVDFFVKCDQNTNTNDEVCKIDVYAQQDDKIIVQRTIKFSELSTTRYTKLSLHFTLPETKFGIEFRIFAIGGCSISAFFEIVLLEKQHFFMTQN